ncbi:hypothetical protein PISMIDRAFT_326422 [Pisolithus microcarpus 441]|uniref:Uso1/p115-like vesicle tethering protein C-terminal domain-containing protein n=1 Tax=Pisolithus microcarpus 441 TaxID=765257 RepID=A0A0C9Z950_9AGAM|nr:hypothetical protein PISMIDRAFT_326422 [Pisolithus microcarpus 441]
MQNPLESFWMLAGLAYWWNRLTKRQKRIVSSRAFVHSFWVCAMSLTASQVRLRGESCFLCLSPPFCSLMNVINACSLVTVYLAPSRSTIHAIISRLTVDALVGHITRVREDDCFKSVGPECMVLLWPTSSSSGALASNQRAQEQEGEIWFDWAFVDFWKSNQYAVQRALGSDPNSLTTSSGPSAESMMLIGSLRDVIRAQAEEIDVLKSKLKDLSAGVTEVNELKSRVGELESVIQAAEEKRKSVEKEQDDLLVLLDEMSTKRRRDKERMKQAGLEVSEDEEEGEEADDEEDGDGE